MCNSTTFALRHTQISLSGILRHFRPPSRHLLLNTHDTNMEFLQLNGPLLDIFLFFSKTKIFHSHPCKCVYIYVCGVCMLSYNLVPPPHPPTPPHPSSKKKKKTEEFTGKWLCSTNMKWLQTPNLKISKLFLHSVSRSLLELVSHTAMLKWVCLFS